MIRIQHSHHGDERTLTITGHANYAPKGKDIVCAGVSAIYQSALLGLMAIAKQYPDHVHIEE